MKIPTHNKINPLKLGSRPLVVRGVDEFELRLAEPMRGIGLRTGQWDEAQSFIEATIAGEFEPPRG